jgi:4-amino-4-deoxy-L-arabinose transferase-like glycosyltransferase
MRGGTIAGVRRRLFDILVCVSLILCAATCVFWVRSYWRNDWVTHNYGSDDRRANWCLYSTRGAVVWGRSARHTSESAGLKFGSDPTHDLRTKWGFLWFMTDAGKAIGVPHWLLVLPLAAGPVTWAVRKFKCGYEPGHCPACGYDLRATPDRCPECGRGRTNPPGIPT